MRQLDETTRPRVTPTADLSPAQRAPGEHLRAIHDHFRMQLGALVDAVAEVRRGAGDPADVRAAVHELAPALTEQQVAGYCAQVCRFVTMHHTVEDQMMYPPIAALPGYAPVIERLMEEHLVVHDHLEVVDDLALAVMADPSRIGDLADAVDALRRDLESHFLYEEEQMAEPMGVLGMGV